MHQPSSSSCSISPGSLGEYTEDVTVHKSPLKIVVECLGTSAKFGKKTEEVDSEEEEPIFAEFDFSCRQFRLNLSRNGFKNNKMISHVLACQEFKIDMERIEDSLVAVLHQPENDCNLFYMIFRLNLEYSTSNEVVYHSRYRFEMPNFQTTTILTLKQLGQFHPSEEITKIFYNQPVESSLTPGTPASLKEYRKLRLFDKLEIALSFEDLASRDALKHLTLKHIRVEGSHRIYFIETKSIHRIKTERWRDMTLCLIPSFKYSETFNDPRDCIFGQITKLDFQAKGIIINILGSLDPQLNKSVTYHVVFIPNRIAIRACTSAVNLLNQSALKTMFTTYEKSPHNKMSEKIKAMRKNEFVSFEWFDKRFASNEEQMLAIKNIVNCTGHPLPQIVFGPPGTGKTSTLVECVAQILKLRPECRILIATQSNSASDEIGVRLLKHVSINKIYRLYSPSLLNPQCAGPNSELKPSSNLRNDKLEWPTKEELKHFKVVISTLVNSSRLSQSDIDAGHFDYIFIDEVSCATEPEALIPIVGLGTNLSTVTSNIILLGDHKQLGPVLTSEEFAGKLGLGVSLMERMMLCSTYSKKPSYDDRYVVQLLDNYRSHPAILKFSSDQFYDGLLRAKMPLSDQQLTEACRFLPNKKFPIIFHSVKSPSQLSGTSSYNYGEIEVVQYYVFKLLATKFGDKNLVQLDIGIITPYLAQLKKLKETVGNRWRSIEIGTAEYFQGREKRVIIITTVKSMGAIGFLSNEKRCNVMLTRAKSLEIVIGNHQTLSTDPFWKRFVDYCIENGGFVNSDY